MKPYRDVFGNPLKKDDIRFAVQAMSNNKNTSPVMLNRLTRLGIGKANKILMLFQDAKVVTAPAADGKRVVLLKGDPAINAALRQLRKGRKK